MCLPPSMLEINVIAWKSIMKVKNLNWQILDDGAIGAEPQDLIHAYYIYPPDYEEHVFVVEGSFQLEVVRNDNCVDVEETTSHKSLEEAKNYAQNLYVKILQKHVTC